MNGPRTRYLRVSEKEVIPVEIHSVKNPADCDYEDLLKDRHVQEILQLLHGTITSYIDTKLNKKANPKQQQKPSDIVTGSSVRFVYMFRSRPASQKCLVEDNFSSQHSDDCSLRCFHVLKEKLVVFAHPLVPGSPKGMSQLMKVLNVKRQSTGQSVSISSYFQKIPTQTVSQTVLGSQSKFQESSGSQSTTVSESCMSKSTSPSRNSQEVIANENQSMICLPEAPPSEGRRKKIKNILQRGAVEKSRRRKRGQVNQAGQQSMEVVGVIENDSKENKSDSGLDNLNKVKCDLPNIQSEKISHVTELHTDRSDEHYTRKKNIDTKVKKESSKTEKMNTNHATKVRLVISDTSDTENNGPDGNKQTMVLKDVKVTACRSPHIKVEPKESFMIGNVHVSHVESPCVKFKDDTERGKSVTLISVDLMNDIHREERKSESSSDLYMNNQSDSADDTIENQSEPRSDSSNEILALPSASFCTKEARRKSNTIDKNKLKNNLKSYEADIDTDSVTESPKFGTRKLEKEKDRVKEKDKIEAKSTLGLPDELTDNSHINEGSEGAMNQVKLKQRKESSKTSHKQRLKRKFPTFSDSDSDCSVPEKKAKVRPDGEKFVNLENMKNTSKKIQISNSFFSGDGGKAQPTLSFFMSNNKSLPKKKSTLENSTKSSEAGISMQMEEEEDADMEDIDCELIKELSDFPKVKNEADVELKNEIRAMSSIAKLNEEHLQYLIRNNEKYLRGIFEGKVSCDRHQAYKKGGKSKRDLNYNSRLGQYSEEQVDTVMESLIAIFCKRHHKYLDYIMKVLLPEMLIKLHMDVHGSSHEESEKTLAPTQ